MKSIKLMAALAIPVMFAACSNEEIAVESPKQFDQVVGAELIGTDISMNVLKGATSRLGVTGWETTDKLGLGWIVTGEYSTEQSVLVAPNNNKWYANHMFAVEDGKFKTKGNAYKGWHFAYFPFDYMESVSQKVWNVNPPQTSKTWASGRVNDALCISPLKFLTRESLDENYQLKESVVFEVTRAVNLINVKTTAADQFASGGSLADLDIKSVTLTLDNGVNYPFSSTVRMDVVNLPQETDAKVTKEALKNSFYAKTNPVLFKTPAASITTDVTKAGFKVSDQAELMTLTASYDGATDFDINDLSIQVVAGSGTFNIEYEAGAEEGSNADTNNKALMALKAELLKGGKLTSVDEKVELNVVLCAKDFETDFLHITDLTEWKDAVDMVDKLGRTSEIFGLDGVVEFNEGNIPMPNCPITVNETASPAGLKITKNLASWPEGLTANVKVINEKTITNATGINGTSIENTGTLKGISSPITTPVINNGGLIQLTKTGSLTNVNNEGGRITVVYGSMVTGTNLDRGVIAYTVAAKEYAYKLNNLIAIGTGKNANVNTLIVKEGRELDLDLTDAGNLNNDDPYNPTGATSDVTLDNLNNINIELNGGTLKGKVKKLVNNVIMNGGTITDVNLNGKLTIESGINVVASETINGVTVEASENTTITAETITGDVVLKGNNTINNAVITGNVTVENGTTNLNGVKINGTLTVNAGAKVIISGNDAKITHIDNYGKLTTNVNVYTETVEIFSGSEAVVAKNMTIWYNTPSYGEFGYTQQGKTDGSILYRNLAYIKNAEELARVLTSNVKKIDVLLTEDIELPIASLGSQTGGSGEYKLGGVDTETININLNGNKLNITTTYLSAIGAKNDDATITIKNGTMTSSQPTGTWDSYDVTFANCNYVIENVIFDKAVAFTNANKSVEMNKVVINETHDYYAIWISAKGQNVKIDGLTVNSDGRGIKIDEQYVGTPEKVTLNVLNASFRTNNKAAIMVKSAAGADITLSNINISGVQADKVNAVWVDEDSANYSDLVSVNGGTKINE